MASAATRVSVIPEADLRSFTECLQGSTHVMALLGAGISAASGLPTFRGAGGLWRSQDATALATPEAFMADPALVWQFYGYRRHMALQAEPNKAHYALAEYARRNPNFITLSQNVDGLSPRANHPDSQLHLLHGSLFDIRCTSFYCKYRKHNDFTDPIVPALAIPKSAPQLKPSARDKTGEEATKSLYNAMEWKEEETNVSQPPTPSPAMTPAGGELDISDINVPIPKIPREDLPTCPECKTGLLRPGVVWFGEPLPPKTLDAIDNWIDTVPKIDLMLVIGTSLQVSPAAGYVDDARQKGARVAVVNMDGDLPGMLEPEDWLFQGDAGVIVPELLRSVIGEI